MTARLRRHGQCAVRREAIGSACSHALMHTRRTALRGAVDNPGHASRAKTLAISVKSCESCDTTFSENPATTTDCISQDARGA